MARYTYNAGLVTQTIDTLYSACDCLDSTNVDIKKGIDMIWSARGAENMDIDFSPITGYQSSVIECIETMATEIKNKAQEIEEYQDAPWYKKLFATIGMGALKLIEGLGTVIEQIGDGLISIVGFIGGIFSSEFQDCLGEFVKTDHVGDAFYNAYEDGWLKGVNKYSAMSHQSTCANVLKGFGVALGYVAISCIPGVGLGATALVAGVGGIGSGTQSGLQAGKTFNQAFGQGLKQGVVAAGTTLIIGGVANKLGSLAKGSKVLSGADEVVNAADDVVNAADDVVNAADDVLNAADDVANAADDVANAADDVANAADDVANAADDVANAADDVANAADDAANAAKPTLRQKAASLANKGVEALSKTRPGGAIGNAAAKIGSTGVNAIATGAGTVTGGMAKAPAASATFKQMNDAINNPSIGQQLYTESQSALENNPPSVKTSDQGVNPGSGSPEVKQEPITVTPAPTSANTSTPGPSVTKPSVTAPKVTMPENKPKPPQQTAVLTPAPTAPVYRPSVSEDVIGTMRPDINIATSSGPNNPGISSLTDSNNINEGIKETVSSEVLDTFGNVSGSLSELSGSKTSIPTSSSPILSSDGSSSAGSKFVPLGAGLGAASLAGIGAKAYLDKREKSEEESDDIETEEWATQDDVEIDYGLENDSEEADYLSPTDELAFTE